jgi:tRNA-dihydrouridine synthase
MSKVPARWDRLPRIAALRDELSPDTRIVGNGDVLSRSDALDKINTFGVDGAMVGRALFGDPWFFHPTRTLPHNLTGLPTSGVDRETLIAFGGQEDGLEVISINERLEVLVEHTHAFVELLPHKSFNVMKKHYKGYCNGFDGAGALRKALMQTSTPAEVEAIVADFLTTVR